MTGGLVMTVLFWLFVATVFYTYVGYPALVYLVGVVRRRGVARSWTAPTISVIVAAYDEAEVIGARIENLLASHYPRDRFEVLIASDGSSDDTVRIASAVDDPRVRVLDLPRRGKAAALAAAVDAARGDVLVFTDANTVFRPDALAQLACNFADPLVGGVAGNTGYDLAATADGSGHGERLYWRYDSVLKALETRTGSVVSAHGGMYAVRRELFRPVEDAAVTDDFAISTAVVAQGRRLVFEPAAVGFEGTMSAGGSEFRRRVRLMTRGLRGVLLRRELLDPTRFGFYSVALASRKVLRRLVPLLFAPLLLLSVALAPLHEIYAIAAAAQLLGISLAALGWAFRDRPVGRKAVLYAPYFFCQANLAAMVALWKVAKGDRIERWTPQRHDGPGPGHDRAALSGAGTP